jgi:hypothetical protein
LGLQDSRGSKRSAEVVECNQEEFGDADEDPSKMAKTSNGRMLSREEKLQRRC